MSGRPNTAWKATMLQRYGGDEKRLHDAMAAIGRKGGKQGTTGGFYADPVRARTAGAKGGSKSRRGYKLQPDGTYKKNPTKIIVQGPSDPIEEAMTDFVNRNQGIK